MKQKLRRYLTLAIAALAMWLGSNDAMASMRECVRDWAQATEIVEREHLATVARLSEAARAQQGAQVIRTVLCEISGAYVYRVVLKGSDGRLRTETVNARRPFGYSPE